MKNYTSFDIINQALNFKTPARLPVVDNFWAEWENIWRAQRNIPTNIKAEDFFGVDLRVPVADECFFPSQAKTLKAEDDCLIKNDGWGRIVRVKPGTWFCETIENCCKNKTDLDRTKFESAMVDGRYTNLLKQVEHERNNGRAVFVKVGGIYIRSCFLRGEIELLMDLVTDEVFARELACKVADHLTEIGLESLKRAGTYDTGIWVYDDMCNVNSPMFSPDVFETIYMPLYKKMVSEFKKAGAQKVILHCDGNLMPLLDMIVEIGFDGINPVERNAGLRVEELLPKYFGKLSFIGGVCNTNILPFGSLSDIRRHIEIIRDVGKNGGLIVGSHSIGPEVPVESFELYRKILNDAQF